MPVILEQEASTYFPSEQDSSSYIDGFEKTNRHEFLDSSLTRNVRSVRIKTMQDLEAVLCRTNEELSKLTLRTSVPELKERIREEFQRRGSVRVIHGDNPKQEIANIAATAYKHQDEDILQEPTDWQIQSVRPLTEDESIEKTRIWLIETEQKLAAGEMVNARLTSLMGVKENAALLRQLLVTYQKSNFTLEADKSISANLKKILAEAKGKEPPRSFDDPVLLARASRLGKELPTRNPAERIIHQMKQEKLKTTTKMGDTPPEGTRITKIDIKAYKESAKEFAWETNQPMQETTKKYAKEEQPKQSFLKRMVRKFWRA